MSLDALLFGECSPWPSKAALVAVLEKSGLRLREGEYAVRILDCDHFVFRQFGGDFEPTVEADASSIDQLIHDARLVSAALATGRIRHRFELYDSADVLVKYLHFNWPAVSCEQRSDQSHRYPKQYECPNDLDQR